MEMLLVHIDASVSKKKKNPFTTLVFLVFHPSGERETSDTGEEIR